ncbi:hypothetical protein H1C71_015198 [Ictidomys tridecemlineatus]|nr:hypothetical protein H1C71_015198 [Ictidomys tridecemlineatus]
MAPSLGPGVRHTLCLFSSLSGLLQMSLPLLGTSPAAFSLFPPDRAAFVSTPSPAYPFLKVQDSQGNDGPCSKATPEHPNRSSPAHLILVQTISHTLAFSPLVYSSPRWPLVHSHLCPHPLPLNGNISGGRSFSVFSSAVSPPLGPRAGS